MFHVLPYGETTLAMPEEGGVLTLTNFEAGVLVGLLVGEGHFGGDGRQPQVTLRMHVRHERIFEWLVSRVPCGRLYGPYNHGGRHYYQWMVRGRPLREELVPFLDQFLRPELDEYVHRRYAAMKDRYGIGPSGDVQAG